MTVAIPEAIGALDSMAGAVSAPAAARAAVPVRRPVSRPAPRTAAPTRYLGRPPSRPAAPKVFIVPPRRPSQAAGRGAPQAMHGRKGGTAGTAAHKLVVAEFILCVLLVGITPIAMRKPGKDGHLYVPNDFVRLSAVCLTFFVLALLSNSPKSSRVAAAFGGLVTMGVVYNASQSLTAIGAIFVSSKQDKGMVRTAAAGTQTIQTPQYTPVDLAKNPSDFGGGPSGGAGVAQV